MPNTLANTEIIKTAVQLACRAPSLHNSQPWRWIAEDGTVQLFLDKDRVLYSTDHSGREALIGCGAVLDHFRVAMAAAGWTANVDRFPNPNNSVHLASVDFSPMDFVTDGHRRRADAILLRRTDRLPFAEPPDWDRLNRSCAGPLPPTRYGSTSSPTSGVQSWRRRLNSPNRFVSTIRRIMPNCSGGQDHSKSPRESRTVHWCRRPKATASTSVATSPPLPTAIGARQFGHDRSKILVLSTYDIARASVLQCGEMLSAVLLDATMAGLATCTLTHITELRASRDIVATLIDQTTTPQALIRVGVAPEIEDVPPATPRRPIDEVFQIRPKDH